MEELEFFDGDRLQYKLVVAGEKEELSASAPVALGQVPDFLDVLDDVEGFVHIVDVVHFQHLPEYLGSVEDHLAGQRL